MMRRAVLGFDRTNLFDKAGQPAGGFDQLMVSYAEADAIHAEYIDGTHIIHDVAAHIVPGLAVTFATGLAAGAPRFRLA